MTLVIENADGNGTRERELVSRSFRYYFPAVLTISGLLCIFRLTNVVLLIELLTGASIAAAALSWLALARASIRVSRVLGTGLLAGFTFGAIPTTVSAIIGAIGPLSGYQPPTRFTALALCQVYSGVAVLWFIGELVEPKISLRDLRRNDLQVLKTFMYIGIVFTAIALAIGDLGYMGADITANSEKTSQPIFAVAVNWMIPPTLAAIVIVFVQAKSRLSRLAYGLVLTLELLAVVPTGRRTFIYSVLLALLYYSTWRRSFSSSTLKVSVTLMMTLLVTSVAWTGFLYLRLATYTLNADDDIRLRELIPIAIDLYESGASPDALKAWQDSDVEARANVIDYNTLLLQIMSTRTPAHGAGVWNEFKWTIPSVLWPNKQIMPEEDFVSDRYNLALTDSPNSIFSAAIVDFGFVGGLFYPVLLSWLIVGVMLLCRRALPQPVPYLCIAAMLFYAFQTEWELWGYFAILRSTILFGTLFSILFGLIFFKRKEGDTSALLAVS